MDENQLVTAITALAVSISSTHSVEDTTMLAAIFVQLGDTLATLAAKRSQESNSNMQNIKC